MVCLAKGFWYVLLSAHPADKFRYIRACVAPPQHRQSPDNGRHDDAGIRELAAEYLQRQGLQVSVAADGRQMREVLATQRIDLLVLDLMLPGTDGIALCRELRSPGAPPLPHNPHPNPPLSLYPSPRPLWAAGSPKAATWR